MPDLDLLFAYDGHTAVLTLNREARRNAISVEMIDLFQRYLDDIEADPNIRSVCITGAGDKAFCSGADLGGGLAGGASADGPKKYAALLKRLASFPRPLIAKLNGHCLAGGLGLMLSCDMVYARADIKIGTPEVGVGLFPMMIGALIFRNATRKKALEMIYTARLMPADEAERMGLITRAYPPDQLDAAAAEKLAQINRQAPLAIRVGRQAFALAEEMPLDRALDHLCAKLGELLQTEDAAEGLTAFFEKREPVWKNR
ncbi:MAG: enoyl-CoA hydratase/isomerase family protein [Myxococcales bacterium]|nr:MAG: enoyl-CoA hydratase/isomerase family protein [Myxococcales bacterium]